jgi:3-methyl-2-oxobutanoate hydroxymethyltransferase
MPLVVLIAIVFIFVFLVYVSFEEGATMSHVLTKSQPITVATLLNKKVAGQAISMVTCYDSAFGRIVEASTIDMVLVGDSLGNVLLGYDSTIPVTLEDMIHHTAAVTRVVKRPFVAADMPFMTYANRDDALRNAAKLMQLGGAHGVKLEGGEAICEQVAALVAAGIPVIGHLGLTPQSVHALSGYKVQAKEKEEQKRLILDAKALQDAGAFCVVLEMIPSQVASVVSKDLAVPTIGIGAGVGCDGQVLVMHDLLGFDASFNPKFLKKYADLNRIIGESLSCFDKDVKLRKFPSPEHSFGG